MKKPTLLPRRAFCLWLLILIQPPAAGESANPGDPWRPLVTEDVLESRIAAAETDPDLKGGAKDQLVALYREALANLSQIKAFRGRATSFEETARTAPDQTRITRGRTHAPPGDESLAEPDADRLVPLEQLDLQLEIAQADLAETVALRADLERRLADQEGRRETARVRRTKAQQEQEATGASLQTGLDADEAPSVARAGRWVLETRYGALGAEIDALDQELLTLPLRLGLLKAQRDETSAEIDRLQRRVDALTARVYARLGAEAEQAAAEAKRVLRETADADPGLKRLAEQNAELADGLLSVSAQLDGLYQEQVRADRSAEQIRANFKRERAAVEVSGLAAGLGELLLEHRASLPDIKKHGYRVRAIADEIAAANVSRLRYLDEAARLGDVDRAVAELAPEVISAETPDLRARLRELLEQRRDLLDRQLDIVERYLGALRGLRSSETRMLEAAEDYDAFLEEHLFWLRTEARAHGTGIGDLPAEMRRLFASAPWTALGQVFRDQAAASPIFWLALLISAALFWKRSQLDAAIDASSALVGKPASDSFGSTLRALVLSLLRAAPLPLLVGITGWLFMAGAHGGALTRDVGYTLVRVALTLYILLALRAICLPRGLAVRHFRWPEASVRRLATELRWLTGVFVPASLIGRMAMDLNPVVSGGLVTRLAMPVAIVALALFLYRTLHPRHGALAHRRLRPGMGAPLRTRPLWFPVLVAFPLLVLAAALGGYVYSAIITATAYLFTLWLIIGLVLLHALAVRWLTLTQRRLAYRAAVERRKAALAAREAAESEAEDPEVALKSELADVDLDAVTEDTRELLRILITFVAFGGLYLIWSSVLPALGILDDVTLWHRTDMVGGVQQAVPVSLADLGLAVIYIIVMAVLAKRLPALLDVILLERFRMAPSSRYTVTTLTTYAIITVGTLLALSTLGAQWSQVQWLVAALGVGIGFGLQEIVANFISGLIILFERPVRVGDMVTVGETDGVVTKIRIRATTIRNLDRKELLVPNKEFITGRLLNWSLSDQVTRVMIVVGVAYGTDVEKAHALMREAAEENERVLDDPKPSLSFEGFGDNSLTLILRAFIDDLDYRIATITDLHKAINRKFEQAGIVIAFPQRDLHLDSSEPLRVRIEDSSQRTREDDGTHGAGRGDGPKGNA